MDGGQWTVGGKESPTNHCLLLTAHCPLLSSSHQVFEDSRGAHSAADAHRDQAVTSFAAFHLVEQRRREFGSGATAPAPRATASSIRSRELVVMIPNIPHIFKPQKERRGDLDRFQISERKNTKDQRDKGSKAEHQATFEPLC